MDNQEKQPGILKLSEISLTSGERIQPSDHLTVIVGPNNAGKSVILNSTWALMTHVPNTPEAPQVAVDSITVELPVAQDLERRLLSIGEIRPPGQYPQGTQIEDHYFIRSQGYTGVLNYGQIRQLTGQGTRAKYAGFYAQLFAGIMQPEGRLGLLGQVPVPNLYSEVPNQPLQFLWADRTLEATVAGYAKRAFGIDITVNRHGGAQVGLHIGKPASPEPKLGERSPYITEVTELPLASVQGHGVQAFLGIVLSIATRQLDVFLIDEPEAFLHPPQARLLGEVLMEMAQSGTQVIVSTHSDDFVRGVLTASTPTTDLTIVRITRPANFANAVHQVPPEAVRQLFEDPLLRYSNILSGIFYKGVVLCEAESDCRYYSAVLDEVVNTGGPATPRPDLLFTQCGGKDRFGKAIRALAAAKAPTAVIADIDLLADRARFEEVYSALGGDSALLEADLNTIGAAVQSQGAKADRAFARHQIVQVLDSSNEQYVSALEADSIRAAVRTASGWALAKKNGRGAVPSGQPLQAFDRILDASAKLGLFLLSVGELERFHPAIGGNKQKWLREVFETGVYRQSSEAADLLKRVAAFIAARQ